MPTNVVTIDDLMLFKEQLLDAILEALEQKENKPKQWLRSREVREMLNISPGTLQNLRINGILPYSKVGGVIFYPAEGIAQVLEENQINLSN